jgi:hypothetical protein
MFLGVIMFSVRTIPRKQKATKLCAPKLQAKQENNGL